MKAGFGLENVNPPLGMLMEGLGVKGGITRIREDLNLRVLWLADGRSDILIVGCDLLFFSRAVIDRFKGALGRAMGLRANDILFNTSHNHAGPNVSEWAYGGPPDPTYLTKIERALLNAAAKAKASLQDATLWGGMTTTDVPVSRRLIDANGKAQWLPWPEGPACRALPVCAVKAADGRTICAMFSVSCHPSMWYETEACGDYPGVAQRLIDEHFGGQCALFLQGCGGDSKPRQIAYDPKRWSHGTWEQVEAAGRDVATAVITCIGRSLTRCQPSLRTHYQDLMWPMTTLPTRQELQAIIANPPQARPEMSVKWATEMLRQMDLLGGLPTHVPVGLHMVQLARGMRLVGLEGESVADLGTLILECYDRGVTFPLGYTDGAQLYLPAAHMDAEDGYEVVSFAEYHWPARLAPVGDDLIRAALLNLQRTGEIPNDPA